MSASDVEETEYVESPADTFNHKYGFSQIKFEDLVRVAENVYFSKTFPHVQPNEHTKQDDVYPDNVQVYFVISEGDYPEWFTGEIVTTSTLEGVKINKLLDITFDPASTPCKWTFFPFSQQNVLCFDQLSEILGITEDDVEEWDDGENITADRLMKTTFEHEDMVMTLETDCRAAHYPITYTLSSHDALLSSFTEHTTSSMQEGDCGITVYTVRGRNVLIINDGDVSSVAYCEFL